MDRIIFCVYTDIDRSAYNILLHSYFPHTRQVATPAVTMEALDLAVQQRPEKEPKDNIALDGLRQGELLELKQQLDKRCCGVNDWKIQSATSGDLEKKNLKGLQKLKGEFGPWRAG